MIRPRPWPLQPLLDATHLTIQDLVVALNINNEAAKDAAERGCTTLQADRWAVRLGKHPIEVWHDWYDRAGLGDDAEYDCGTRGGYAWHRRNGTTPCVPCRAAEAAYRRQRRAVRRQLAS